MLSLEQCRQIDPTLLDLSDEKLSEVRGALYKLAKLALSAYLKKPEARTPVATVPTSQMGLDENR